MESHKLEITVHSAKNLENVKLFGTMDPYAMFWITEGGMMSQAYKTNVAKKAGSCPVWNNSMEFQIDPTRKNYVLHCEIQHDGKLLDRLIGEVEISFKELLAGDASGQRVSYPVKTPPYGEVKGEIIVSHKFTGLAPVISNKKDGSKTNNGTSATKKKDSTETRLTQGKKEDGMVKKKKDEMMKKKDGTETKPTQGKKEDGMIKKKKDGIMKKEDGTNVNKKVGQMKKKDGVMKGKKKIATNMGTKVAAGAAVVAGTVGAVYASEAIFSESGDEDDLEDTDEGDLTDTNEDVLEDVDDDEDDQGDLEDEVDGIVEAVYASEAIFSENGDEDDLEDVDEGDLEDTNEDDLEDADDDGNEGYVEDEDEDDEDEDEEDEDEDEEEEEEDEDEDEDDE